MKLTKYMTKTEDGKKVDYNLYSDACMHFKKSSLKLSDVMVWKELSKSMDESEGNFFHFIRKLSSKIDVSLQTILKRAAYWEEVYALKLENAYVNSVNMTRRKCGLFKLVKTRISDEFGVNEQEIEKLSTGSQEVMAAGNCEFCKDYYYKYAPLLFSKMINKREIGKEIKTMRIMCEV